MLAPLRNPEDGQTIGFTMVLQDLDSNSYKTLQWTPGVTTGKNPSQFGKIIFSRARPSLEGAGWMISADRSAGHEGLSMRMIAAAPDAKVDEPRAVVFDENGKTVSETPLQAVDEKKAAYTATLATDDLAPGEYRIRVVNSKEEVLVEHQFTRSDTARLQQLMEGLPARIDALFELMRAAETRGMETKYARNAAESASLFLKYSEEDAAAKSYDLALHNMNAVTTAVEMEIDRLTAWMESEGGMPDWARVPEIDYTNVSLDGAHMVVDGRRVLLAGPLSWTWGMLAGIESIAEVGFNTIRVGVGAHHYFDDEGRMKTLEDQPLWPVQDIMRKAKPLNLSVGVGLLPHKVWEGAGRRGKLTLDEFHEIYDVYARRLINNATKGRVLDYTISVEGQRSPVKYEEKHHRQTFLDHLASSYESVEELNELYGSKYDSLEAIPFPDGLPENPAMKYDYTRVRQIMIANELAWAADKIRSLDPGAAVTGYPYVWTFREAAAYYEHAIDPELDADCMDIVSCDTSGSYMDERYAMSTITWMAGYYSLMESIAGDRPLFDGEFHYANRRKIYPDNWSRSIYFHAYMHGLNGSYSWVWHRSARIDAALLFDANVLLGSGRASLDLQRVAEEVCAFQDRPVDIVLLYSNASSPHSRRRDDMVLSQKTQTDRIFEGLYFEGLKVGYVTERMLQQGDYDSSIPLIIPNCSHVPKPTREALLRFAESGGRILMVGDSLLYTPQGADYPAFPELDTVANMAAFASADEAREAVVPYLRALGVEAPNRPAIENGKPFPTVEWRCAKGPDGRDLMYLHNLGHDTAAVALPAGFRGATDLLTGVETGDEIELDSLEFVLLRSR
jgi:hypothetical protein